MAKVAKAGNGFLTRIVLIARHAQSGRFQSFVPTGAAGRALLIVIQQITPAAGSFVCRPVTN
jgi:hypothetical protein